MASLPRFEILNPLVVGIVHCWTSCVRQAYLCGWDPFLKKDCTHRKQWIQEGLKRLAGAMAIDVLDFAVLDTHLHTVLRNRPDLVASWSDEEVARRWWQTCPDRKEADGSAAEPTPFELNQLQADPVKLADYRTRLSSISWFMRLLTQPIARRANLEDGKTGRFFAQRFGSEPIESVAQLLACSIYVDLNLVRAGIALTPETSEFTSAFRRIQGRLRRQQAAGMHSEHDADPMDEDAWLAPIYLDTAAVAYQSPQQVAAANRLSPGNAPVFPARASNKGFLPLTLDQYLELLDWTGRQLRSDKPGAIPADLAPILERIEVPLEDWKDTIQHYAPRTRRPTDGCLQNANAPPCQTSPCAGVESGRPDTACRQAAQPDATAQQCEDSLAPTGHSTSGHPAATVP